MQNEKGLCVSDSTFLQLCRADYKDGCLLSPLPSYRKRLLDYKDGGGVVLRSPAC